MPVPTIGRKTVYYRYLQYSDYDRLRYSRRLLNWLDAESIKFSGGGSGFQFGVNVAVSGSEIFTATSHGLSVGEGPFIVEVNTVAAAATNTMTVASQPSAGDMIDVVIGILTYAFTFIAAGGTPTAEQIALGTTAALTAANIRTVLNGVPGITVTGTGTSIVVTATDSGTAGNSIRVDSDNTTAITGGGRLDGGTDPFITSPLQENTLYYIHSVPNGNQFLLTRHPGGSPIRPIAAGSGPDRLVTATSAVAIYELLRSYTARTIAVEDDIDDLSR